MYCPVCNSKDTKVVDSRVTQDGYSIRRRRECMKCQYRFSTVEEMELLDIVVIKSDGKRESYDRKKVESGMLHSLRKRPYMQESFDRMINAIERDIQKKNTREITSREVGEIVMDYLRKFDKVAYIRFASIYLSFEDVDNFESTIQSLQSRKRN